MDKIQKMLQTIIEKQATFRQEVLKMFGDVDKRFDEVETRVSQKIDDAELKLENKIDKSEKKLTARIDQLGKQLAYLEDDAPTREEFDQLKTVVNKIKQTPTTSL